MDLDRILTGNGPSQFQLAFRLRASNIKKRMELDRILFGNHPPQLQLDFPLWASNNKKHVEIDRSLTGAEHDRIGIDAVAVGADRIGRRARDGCAHAATLRRRRVSEQ